MLKAHVLRFFYSLVHGLYCFISVIIVGHLCFYYRFSLPLIVNKKQKMIAYNNKNRIFTIFIALLSVISVFGQKNEYYRNADGKKGKELKTALASIVICHNERTYKQLWTDFTTTDRMADGKVWDMYSNATNFTFGVDQAGNYNKEGDCYNREHSMPKSWFNDAKPMYTDLHHLVPTDGYVNNRRANYPFGETNGEQYKSIKGFSKLGKSTVADYSGTVFEPNDEYKGDFARIYFYMITCYEDRISSWESDMLDGKEYPGFRKWALDMLLKWAKEDPVSDKEINRNEAVYSIQNNRNPYVDYPGLEQYVWGSMTDVAFDYDNYKTPTSIYVPTCDMMTVDVYTITGMKVRSKADALTATEGLNRGIYIINKKKVIVQ